jgi:hypothetical protein
MHGYSEAIFGCENLSEFDGGDVRLLFGQFDKRPFNRRKVLLNECAGTGRMNNASLFSANLRDHHFHIDFKWVMAN